MHLPIRVSIEYLLRGRMVQTMKEVRPSKNKKVVDTSILRELKKRVNTDELGAIVQEIRET